MKCQVSDNVIRNQVLQYLHTCLLCLNFFYFPREVTEGSGEKSATEELTRSEFLTKFNYVNYELIYNPKMLTGIE